MITLRPYQKEASNCIVEAWKENVSTLVVMPTGCHEPYQNILRFDGNLVFATNIEENTNLMGMDGKPRMVIKVHRGESEMVRIIPTKGEPFIVTHDHMLTLVHTRDSFDYDRDGELIDVKVCDWMRWSKTQKHIHKLLRVAVNFPIYQSDYLIKNGPHPYLMGVLLGDGSFRANLSITTADLEILEACIPMLAPFNLQLVDSGSNNGGKARTYLLRTLSPNDRSRRNFRAWLEFFGLNNLLSGDKHIPKNYLCGTRDDRLQLIAGLMDTDGSNQNNGFDYISKSLALAKGVEFIARSLGFSAYVQQCYKSCQTGAGNIYYRLSISGDCSIIPCRVPRKKCAVRTQKKSVLRTGFTVEPVGKGEFVGFTVNKDNRYLMGDFTVTHNCGKTIVFADIIRRSFPRRALVLAHREELIFQAQEKIERTIGLKCQIEMGDIRSDDSDGLFGRSQVIISTIQTQCAGGDGAGRMGKFDPMRFGILIIDESHRSTSPSYRRVIEYYKINPNLKILGVTATPDRADEAALGQVFDSVAFNYELLDAIHDGWLVPIEQQMVKVGGLDFSTVKTSMGDLNSADLAAVMESENNLHGIATPSLEIIGDKRTIVFAVTVKQAETLCEIFNRHKKGIASWVCGTTKKDERKDILKNFGDGSTQIVVNVGVLTEGYDNPAVEVVCMARPTKSRLFYAQCVGRATRTLPGLVDGLETAEERREAIANSPKKTCLVVDFVGNAGRHKLCTSADILGGKVADEILERAIAKAKEEGGRVRMDQLIDQAEEAARQEAEERRLAEAARRARLVAKVNYSVQSISPFDVLQIKPDKQRGWDNGKHLSEKQRNILTRQGIDPDSIPFAQAKQLVGELCSRYANNQATFKQAKLLQKHGYATDCSMKEASAIIDALAKNGWRKPSPV